MRADLSGVAVFAPLTNRILYIPQDIFPFATAARKNKARRKDKGKEEERTRRRGEKVCADLSGSGKGSGLVRATDWRFRLWSAEEQRGGRDEHEMSLGDSASTHNGIDKRGSRENQGSRLKSRPLADCSRPLADSIAGRRSTPKSASDRLYSRPLADNNRLRKKMRLGHY